MAMAFSRKRRWSSMESRFPAFLKTVMDDQGNCCSTEMKVPIQCIRQHIHRLKMKVQVKGWKNWSIGLWGSTPSSVNFRKGWSQFAAENRLQTGDHMVFRLVQDNCFQVRIYDKHGNEKTNKSNSCPESDFVNPNLFSVAKTTSSVQANPGSSSAHSFCETTSSMQANPGSSSAHSFCETTSPVQTNPGSSSAHSFSSIPFPDHISSHKLINLPVSDTEENPINIQSPFPDHISSDRLINLPVPDTKETSISIPNHFPDHVSSHKLINMPNSGIEEKIYHCNYYESTRPPVTAAQKLKAVHDAELYRPKGPYTTIKMKQSHVYRGFFLALPKRFSKAWLPIEKTRVELIDSGGQKWGAIWLGFARNGLSGGWQKFALDHCIEEDDVCVFELVSGTNAMPCLLVNIFRVLELPPHLLNGGNDHKFIRHGGKKRRHKHKATIADYVIDGPMDQRDGKFHES